MKDDSILKVSQLTVAYEKRIVLQDVNFKMRGGQVLGLIGPNGAGKTTLIRAMSGVLKVNFGDVLFNGEDMARLSPLEGTPDGSCPTGTRPAAGIHSVGDGHAGQDSLPELAGTNLKQG